MKKVYFVALIILIVVLVLGIIIFFKQYYDIKNEIKMKEELIEQRQEINKEYVYLFKQTKNDIKKEIMDEQKKVEEQELILISQQDKLNTMQEEIRSIEETIEIRQGELNKLLEEEKRLELERIEKSTVRIENEVTYLQFPEYPTGCESVSLYILLKYNGIDTTVDEIVNRLKKGDLPYKIEDKMYGGNPNMEFIGDPRNDYSYGVLNTPIAEVANTFREGVQNREGLELEEILEIVKENRPVLVWTTVGNITARISTMWIYKPTGEKIYWKGKEHAVVIIGYNDLQVIVSDPYIGKIAKYDRETFKMNYDYMGKRAVYY